ncbi:MAG TPA: hypothetical protein PLO78_08540 [Candidatus Omnitrophota bacterium]|nr:hypothetical protein [Candidatus Omnitrophota bacterium]
MFFAFIFTKCVVNLHAAEEPWTEQLSRQFDEIKMRLDNLDKQQKEIQAKDDKILEELERVRVWSRRR